MEEVKRTPDVVMLPISEIKIKNRFRIAYRNIDLLAASIEEHGLLHPVVVNEENVLVAGARRIKAYEYLGKDRIPARRINIANMVRAEYAENQCREDFTLDERVVIGASIEKELGNRQGQRSDLLSHDGDEVTGRTDEVAAKLAGFGSRNTYHQAKFLAEHADDLTKEDIDNGVTSVSAEYQKLKKEAKKQRHRETIERLDTELKSTVDGNFDVIVIDPPWPYGLMFDERYDPAGRRGATPYPEMSLEKIKVLKLPAADDCILWLWTTHRFLRYSFEVLDAWGFRDVSVLTWVKDRMGLGVWLRTQTEYAIMAVKGKPKIRLTNQTTVINGPMREHSRKPDEFYAMVDSLCIGRKLDYFSREPREGWEQFGNDKRKFSKIEQEGA